MNESFTVNGTQGKLINESGLYSLILSSKLPNARAYKRWVLCGAPHKTQYVEQVFMQSKR